MDRESFSFRLGFDFLPASLPIGEFARLEPCFIIHFSACGNVIPEIIIGNFAPASVIDQPKDRPGAKAAAGQFGIKIRIDRTHGIKIQIDQGNGNQTPVEMEQNLQRLNGRLIKKLNELTPSLAHLPAMAFTLVLKKEVELFPRGFGNTDFRIQVPVPPQEALLPSHRMKQVHGDTNRDALLAISARGFVNHLTAAPPTIIQQNAVDVFRQAFGNEGARTCLPPIEIGARMLGSNR